MVGAGILVEFAITPPSEHKANFITGDHIGFCPSTAKLKDFGSANKAICVLQ